jgi:hypothetical protein
MRWLALLSLLLASPALAQTLYLRDGTGDISGAIGTDRDLNSARGASAQTYTLPGSETDNWNESSMGGSTLNGAWDCTVNVDVSSGGGGPNRMTVAVYRINSSGVIQETIFSEESGALTKGANTDYACTGVASKSVTFAAGDGVMFTAYQSNGTRTITLNYNGADTDDSEIVIPAAATPTPTATQYPHGYAYSSRSKTYNHHER